MKQCMDADNLHRRLKKIIGLYHRHRRVRGRHILPGKGEK